jgi:UDP-N-acetylmuramate: L-alanyl-gamma-D-glutamyl-meso-diaminopimelate ligase
MQSSPSTVYSQSLDKQRVVVVGKSKGRIVQLITFVLAQYRRKFDYTTPSGERIADSPVILIEPASDVNRVSDFKHHILVLSQLSPSEEPGCSLLAGATPKAGTIIYDDTDKLASAIAKVERPDVSVSGFGIPRHETNNGKIVLISKANDKFHTQFESSEDLRIVGAAKETLKKIGISSGMFYQVISSFR